MFRSDDFGEVTEVSFPNRRILDQHAVDVIREQLLAVADMVGPGKIRLNFGGVEYMSSAALGLLINLAKRVDQLGGQLAMCNIDPQIYEVFQITRLDKFFRMEQAEGKGGGPRDEGGEEGGVPSKLRPKKPSGGAAVILPFPSRQIGLSSTTLEASHSHTGLRPSRVATGKVQCVSIAPRRKAAE